MNIYVGNLSRTVSEDALRKLFQPFGEVASIKVMKDKFTGEPRGFAFVEMPLSNEAQLAMAELNGKELDGQRLRVNEARPPEARPARGPRFSGSGNRRPSSNNSWNNRGRV